MEVIEGYEIIRLPGSGNKGSRNGKRPASSRRPDQEDDHGGRHRHGPLCAMHFIGFDRKHR